MVSRIWCLVVRLRTLIMSFSSSFWIPDDTEDHNICMIEESGPLSASYQIHQCDQNGQKPVARCHISELELDHGSPLPGVTFLSRILYAVFSNCPVCCFSFHGLQPQKLLANIYCLWPFSCLIVSVEMTLYIMCCVYSERQNTYCPCQI